MDSTMQGSNKVETKMETENSYAFASELHVYSHCTDCSFDLLPSTYSPDIAPSDIIG